MLFTFSFCFSFTRSSNCKSVLVSISRVEMRIFDFLLEVSLGHQLQYAIIVSLGQNVVSWAQTCNKYFNSSDFSNLPLVQTFQFILSVGLSVIADNTSSHFAWEGLNVVVL